MADLSVTKADSPDPVPVEAELTYTIVVTNSGPADASGVTYPFISDVEATTMITLGILNDTVGRDELRRLLGRARRDPAVRRAVTRNPRGFSANHGAFAPLPPGPAKRG